MILYQISQPNSTENQKKRLLYHPSTKNPWFLLIAAAILLSNKFAYQNISHKVTNLAIKNTKWPARLQQIKNNRLVKKLPANFKLFLDGAHNSAGAKNLRC